MDALLASFGMVALAEMGDKTQLLSFVLAARYPEQSGRIIAGILLATLVNHAFAAAIGDWTASHVPPHVMRWILGLAFLGFAVWALVPDTLADDGRPAAPRGAFATTLVLFFIAEMGDKTQLATVALGAKYASVGLVALGTTLGMLAANVPAVLVGEALTRRIPLSRLRLVAAAVFAAFGTLILLGVDFGLGLGL